MFSVGDWVIISTVAYISFLSLTLLMTLTTYLTILSLTLPLSLTCLPPLHFLIRNNGIRGGKLNQSIHKLIITLLTTLHFLATAILSIHLINLPRSNRKYFPRS